MTGLRTWVINLDRAPERLARVRAQLQQLQLPFTRLAAVDARALTPEQRAALDEPAYRRKHGMSPVPGELGCYLSHVAVMRAFLASDATFALVLEDDVLLKPSLPAVLQGLMRHAARFPDSQQILKHAGDVAQDRHLGMHDLVERGLIDIDMGLARFRAGRACRR